MINTVFAIFQDELEMDNQEREDQQEGALR